MSAPDLKPIPIPPAQRLRHAKMTLLPTVVFLGSLVVIAFLWKDRINAPTMVGQADEVLSNVSSHQAGVVAGLRVGRFQKVRAGEPLANVLIADPKLVEASLAVIRSELDVLRANLDPIVAQQRNAVDYAQLRLDWMRQRTDLASARVNLQFAESEWHRNDELFKEKLVSQSEMELSRSTYQAIQKQVDELTRLVSEGEESFKELQPPNTGSIAHVSDEPMQAAIAAQEAKLRLTEAQLSPVTLRAPIDGTVTAVYFRSGESVTAGQPIVTIAADVPTRITAYIRQPISIEPKPGAKVLVRTRGVHRVTATAEVLDVGAQLGTMPLVLQSPMKLAAAELALPVNISLPSAMSLRPGELVDISLLPTTD